MTPEQFDEIIDNWVRWSKARYGLRQVESLEGRYRSRQEWDYLPTGKGPVDKVLAVATEEAWGKIPSLTHKLLLKWHWIFVRPPWAIVKSLRARGVTLHPHAYDSEVRRAMTMFCEAVDNQKKRVDHSGYNLATPKASPAMIGGRSVGARVAA